MTGLLRFVLAPFLVIGFVVGLVYGGLYVGFMESGSYLWNTFTEETDDDDECGV